MTDSTSNTDTVRANVDQTAPAQAAPPPPPVVRTWVRLVVAFTVSVALGLAPYLGKVHVPGFDALLTLIPDDLQSIALPLSAAFMGLIAVWIQWSAGDNPKETWLRKYFKRTFLIAFTGLVALFIVETFVVVRIPIPADNNRTGVYLIGFSRIPTSPCPPAMSNIECVKRVTPDEGKLALVWGDTQLQLAKLTLLGTYFWTTGSFGLLVGLLVLRGTIKPHPAPARAPRTRRTRPRSR